MFKLFKNREEIDKNFIKICKEFGEKTNAYNALKYFDLLVSGYSDINEYFDWLKYSVNPKGIITKEKN